MVEKKKNPNEDRKQNLTFSIVDFIDLSIIELLTLEFLIRYGRPIVRHILYNQITNFLLRESAKLDNLEKMGLSNSELKYFNFLKAKKERKKKILSTSSFYNSLSNLEKKGLIKFNKNERNKIISIEKTVLTNELMNDIIQHFISFWISYDFKIIIEIQELLLKKTGVASIENLLVIWLNFVHDMRLLQMFSRVSDTVFLLSKIDPTKEISESGLDNIKLTSIYNARIREPNEMFDAVIMPFYLITEIEGMNRIDLINDSLRVLKEDGNLVLIIDKKLPASNEVVLNRIVNLYNKANMGEVFTKQQILEDINKSNLKNYELIEHKGIFIVIGKK